MKDYYYILQQQYLRIDRRCVYVISHRYFQVTASFLGLIRRRSGIRACCTIFPCRNWSGMRFRLRRIGFSLRMFAMRIGFRIACSRSSTVFLEFTFPFFVPTHTTKQNTKYKLQSFFARLRRPHCFDVHSLHWFAASLSFHRFLRRRQRRIRGFTATRTTVSTVSTVSIGSGHADGGFDLRFRGGSGFRGDGDGNGRGVLLAFCTERSRHQSGNRSRSGRRRIGGIGGPSGVGNPSVLGGLRDDADGKALGAAAGASTWNQPPIRTPGSSRRRGRARG